VNALGALLRQLDATGVRIWLEETRIGCSGPLTPEQAAEIRKYRDDVIELLKLHGDALLPLFRDPDRPLTDRERALVEANAAELRQRFRILAGERQGTLSAQAFS
jgi:TubC N-terminal docking domain